MNAAARRTRPPVFVFPVLLVVSAVIAVSCKDGAVTPDETVATVYVRGSEAPVLVGKTTLLTVQVRDAHGDLLQNRVAVWSSSDDAVAEVDEHGLVLGILGGVATITATVEGVSGSANVQVVNPVPEVERTEPTVVTVGSASSELRVIGNGFVKTSVGRWRGGNRPTTYVSAFELRVALTAEDAETSGEWSVDVVNPAPGGGTSSPHTVKVEYPLPTVSSISPTSVVVGNAPFLLTVNGTGFAAGSEIWFGHTSALPDTVTPTTLRVTIPAGFVGKPGYTEVSVANPSPGGGRSNSLGFRILIDATTLPKIGAGRNTTCAVARDGAAYCWGQNDQHQLGDGSTVDRPTPARVMVPSGTSIVSLSTGALHSCGLDDAGHAWCWGPNQFGELGRIPTGPSDPDTVPGDLVFVSISAGATSTCGVDADGNGLCWGSNYRGALGRGTSGGSSYLPVRVDFGTAFRSISVGSVFACGLTTSGQVACWGANDYGQLGNGTATDRSSPAFVQGGLTFRALSAGVDHVCAIATTGQLYCWGHGFSGQLGTGTRNSYGTPVPVAGIGEVASVSAGAYFTCALTADGATWCWGQSDTGQTGDASTDDQLSPVPVSGLANASGVATGEGHACARLGSGEMYCWGLEGFGQLGANLSGVTPHPVAVTGGAPDLHTIAAGGKGPGGFACGIDHGGWAYCWGSGRNGELGDGGYEHRNASSYVPIVSFTALSLGLDHACGLNQFGLASCWGVNSSGQLGTGNRLGHGLPTSVAGGRVFTAISAGDTFTCAIDYVSQVFCWGSNLHGEIGNDGPSGSVFVPTAAATPGGVKFSSISAGMQHACAISEAARLYCWGLNSHGQLGIGNATDQRTPVLVDAIADVKAVSAGWEHTCALTGDGTAYCWGSNWGGELGNGQVRAASQSRPVAVFGGHTFRTIAAGHFFTCAVATDDTGYCWGDGAHGQTGQGLPVAAQGTPASVVGGLAFVDIAPGYRHACGVTFANTAYCWGLNIYGELGDGTWGIQFVPVRVQGLTLAPARAVSGRRR